MAKTTKNSKSSKPALKPAKRVQRKGGTTHEDVSVVREKRDAMIEEFKNRKSLTAAEKRKLERVAEQLSEVRKAYRESIAS